MTQSGKPSVYSQVAYDIATKIATGQWLEGTRFTGRSLMSTQYGVSQETIRRALKLLADMDIVTVQQNSGVRVLSKSNALGYVDKFLSAKDSSSLKRELRELLAEHERLTVRIVTLVDQITDLHDRFKSSDPLRNYEFEIHAHSPLVGQTVKNSQFWQRTQATIVAIKREQGILLSPGPDAVFEAFDCLVVVGNPGIIDKVKAVLE